MRYWLFKSEPNSYSIDDLKRDRVTPWDGIRNYQARNILRDEVRKGDCVFIYHSSAGNQTGIVGLATIASKAAYPDPSQFDPKSIYYDPKSSPEHPRWLMVDVRYTKTYTHPVLLTELKTNQFFNAMMVTKRGTRLSIQPVSERHAKRIIRMAT